MIVCGVLTDGRDELLARTLASAREHLAGQVDHLFVVDDSGRYGPRKGLAGAVQTLWSHALGVGADYLFHLEDDWRFNETPDLATMVNLLVDFPDLAQVVLQRQALTASEHAAGGVAAHAHWEECVNPWAAWVQQDDIFSLNPCLVPRRILEMGWPAGNEAGMTERLRGRYLSAFWGRKDSAPQVHHLGDHRSPGWTL